jgi:hypothetical protein
VPALDRESRAADIPRVDSESFWDPEASERVIRGARCVLCGDAVRLGEDAFVTPDFIADEEDPLWRCSDAVIHRACFYVWDRRKVFVARFNRLARGLVASDGTGPFLTSEGRLVRRPASPDRRARLSDT